MSGRGLTFDRLVAIALEAASSSTCRSQRGAVAFTGGELEGRELVAVGFNQKPGCDGSERCKATCRREAVHAEQAMLASGVDLAAGGRVEVIHVKLAGGVLAVSGGPDCVECSKLLRFAGVIAVWLYHVDGWRRYPIEEFHRLSIEGDRMRVNVSIDGREIARAIVAGVRSSRDRCPYCGNRGCTCDHAWGESCRCEARFS